MKFMLLSSAHKLLVNSREKKRENVEIVYGKCKNFLNKLQSQIKNINILLSFNKPLQGIAPTECLPSGCLLACLYFMAKS